MSSLDINLEVKIGVIGSLIEHFRAAPGSDREQSARAASDPHNVTYRTLKAIAVDLQARLATAPGPARLQVGQKVAAAVRANGARHMRPGQILDFINEVISRWPVIEYALERAEREHQISTDRVRRFTEILGKVADVTDPKVQQVVAELVLASDARIGAKP